MDAIADRTNGRAHRLCPAWTSIREGASLGAKAAETITENLERTLIPAPISYAGMPSERWWEFEARKWRGVERAAFRLRHEGRRAVA